MSSKKGGGNSLKIIISVNVSYHSVQNLSVSPFLYKSVELKGRWQALSPLYALVILILIR
jgi:hypothetical protein